MIVLGNPKYGNCKIYDMRSRVNVSQYSPAFERFSRNRKYSLEIIANVDGRMMNVDGRMTNVDDQRSNEKKFKISKDVELSENASLTRLISTFIPLSLPDFKRLRLIGQRLTPDHEEYWTRNYSKKSGIFCVASENSKGSLLELMRLIDGRILSLEIPPGHLVVFDDIDVLHRLTPPVVLNTSREYRGEQEKKSLIETRMDVFRLDIS